MADTTSTSVSPFNFGTHAVRVVMQDGQPWFVAKDVCDTLGYSNSRKTLADHLDDDEKGVTNSDTLGGNQQMTIINESGLYALVLRSRKPEARKFAKWVTSEVLPSIRKTGQYSAPEPQGPAIDYRRIDATMAQCLKEEVARVVAAGVQSYGETWARLHRKFRVNSYLELPATRFSEAIEYLRAKRPHGLRVLQADMIDPADLLLGGQCDPVPLTAAQQAMIQHRAWELAGEASQLIRKHIERRVAYNTHESRRTDGNISAIVSGTTLGNALTHYYGTQLGTIAPLLKHMHSVTGKALEKFNAEMGKLAAAGLV